MSSIARRGVALDALVAGGAGSDGAPLYRQVYRQLRDHILSGTLKPGARLPSARTMADDLRLSRNTIETAFRQLVSEGFIERRIGAGSVVTKTVGQGAPFSGAGQRARVPVTAPPRVALPVVPVRLSGRGRVMADLGQAEMAADHPDPFAMDVVGFPTRTWNRLVARRSRRAGAGFFQAVNSFGTDGLRSAIADHARLTRGVRCDARQVVIVNSTQQALDLAARLLLDPGAVAAIEDPVYRGARAALLAAGAVVRSVPVDSDGLVADELTKKPGARLLYLTPSHQFPLGVTMSLARRLAVLRWAAATGAWIVEDDYDSEFRYAGRPIAALQGLDRADRVLYLGSYNKVLFPGLRLAYLIVPEALVDGFAAARRITDGFSSPLMQAVLADFLTGGHFATYLRVVRAHYAACRDALVNRIAARWGSAVRLGPSDTGLHLAAHLPSLKAEAALFAASPEPDGLGIAPLSRYYFGDRRQAGVLLSYAASTPERVVRAVDHLAAFLR